MTDSDLAARLAGALAALPMVELAYLYGSHAQGRSRSDSDIDVAVQVTVVAAQDPHATLAQLFDHLGRVVSSNRLDIVLLNSAPSLLRHRVLSSGRLLFERTPAARMRFATRTIRDYQDMQIRREFFYRKRVSRLKEGGFDGGSGDLLTEARRASRLLGKTQGLPEGD